MYKYGKIIFGLAVLIVGSFVAAMVANAQTVAPTQMATGKVGTVPSAIPDTQIAEVLITINEGEIDAGKVAKSNAQSKAVRDFAAMMVDQHEKNERDTKSVAKDNKINPEDSEMAKRLSEEAKATVKDLKRQSKSDFDRAYVKHQIAMHEKALATLREQLIPSAQNPAFKAHLEKTQTAVSNHLEHARSLERTL